MDIVLRNDAGQPVYVQRDVLPTKIVEFKENGIAFFSAKRDGPEGFVYAGTQDGMVVFVATDTLGGGMLAVYPKSYGQGAGITRNSDSDPFVDALEKFAEALSTELGRTITVTVQDAK